MEKSSITYSEKKQIQSLMHRITQETKTNNKIHQGMQVPQFKDLQSILDRYELFKEPLQKIEAILNQHIKEEEEKITLSY